MEGQKMVKMYRHSYIFSFLIISLSGINLTFSMEHTDHERSHVEPTPTKLGAPYGGARQDNFEEDILVSSCLSLGGGCLDKINSVIKQADQFVVSFMYRFNSPTLMRTLKDKYLAAKTSELQLPVILFLDYNQTYNSSFEGSAYANYVKELINTVPVSLVKLGSRPFHHKVTISKKVGEEAIIILGSANATYESDNEHSEDIIFVQSNKLAQFYLLEFETLLRRDPSKKKPEHLHQAPQVKVFHEHRFQADTSNIDMLSEMQKLLDSGDKKTMSGHKGNITTVALSTGNPEEEGNKRCLEVVTQALGNPLNTALFLFENFISLNEELKQEAIWENLNNKTPKFIVVEDNKHNRGEKSEPSLALIEDEEAEDTDYESSGNINNLSKNNSVLFFRPFTGHKFHHKLILQYLKKKDPIIYTGSFHISTSAVKKNSEMIIGIQSQGLADEILASLLTNSGLGKKPEVWAFIAENNDIFKKVPSFSLDFSEEQPQQAKTQLLKAAEQLKVETTINLDRYEDRLDRIYTEILATTSNASEQRKIGKYFSKYLGQFRESKEDGEMCVQAINGLKEAIFTKESIYSVWAKYLLELEKEIKSKDKDDDMPTFPEYNPSSYDKWLVEMKGWLQDAIKENKNNKIKIEKELDSIQSLYYALKDLEDYVSNLDHLATLKAKLERAIEKLSF